MVQIKDFDAKAIVSRYRSGRISRRELGRLAGMLGIAGMSTSMAPQFASAADTALVFTWAGYDDENLWGAFKSKHGSLPRFSFFGDEEEGLIKMINGFEADVMLPCSYKIRKWNEAGLLKAIDTSRLKNWNDILPSLRTMPGVEQNGEVVWVPVDWGQTSLVYRTDLAPEYSGDNESWAILWDEKYKGRVACFDSIVDCVAIAGIMAGMDNPYDYRKQSDLDATRDQMRKLVPNLLYFSNDSTTMEQGIASGELVAATVWNESVVRLKAEGHPIAYMNPKESGPMTWVCGLTIAKNTQFEDQAYDLIDAFLEPESRVYELTEFGYGVSTQSAYDMVDEVTLAELGLSKDPEKVLSAGSFQEEILNEEGVQAMFDEVKAGF